jgi:hypothetical protein
MGLESWQWWTDAALGQIAKTVLVLLPSTVYPAIYLAYLAQTVVSEQKRGPDDKVLNALTDEIDFLYHWRNYVVPMGMSMIAITIATYAALARAHISLLSPEVDQLFSRTHPAVFAAVAGSFVANLLDLVQHAKDRNLTAQHMQAGWVGLASSAILGFVITAVIAENAGVYWIAFGLGVLPIKRALEAASKKTLEALKIAEEAKPMAENATLHNLQGMTLDVIATLGEQNVSSVQKLAYANPIKLVARTNLEWVAILDFIDQALLFNYVGPILPELRKYGVRGAIEMGTVYEEMQNPDDNVRLAAIEVIAKVAEVLSISPQSVKYTVSTLYEDLTVRYLAHLFGSGLGRVDDGNANAGGSGGQRSTGG